MIMSLDLCIFLSCKFFFRKFILDIYCNKVLSVLNIKTERDTISKTNLFKYFLVLQ